MDDKLQSGECARLLKALADPDRLRIIQCLCSGPKNVSELTALLDKEYASVSHHLGVLRHAGLVRDEKRGKFVVYSMQPELLRATERGQAEGCIDLGCCRLQWETHEVGTSRMSARSS